jgi:hypothetical protein
MLAKKLTNKRLFPSYLLALALAPFQLAAKGCDVATVGEDGCAEGEACGAAGAGDPGDGEVCGGFAGLACAAGEYCDYPAEALCGAADATGVCKAKPEACTEQYDPVCGCDDVTYGNACAAQAAGVSVASEGECGAASGSCGGMLGQGCGAGEYCNYAPEAQCGAADVGGVCQPKPEACDDIYQPVCGCDDVTYANACEAAGAGVSVASSGECGTTDPGGEVCGGLQGLGCADGEFCSFSPEAQCGASDMTGVCAPTPEACDAVYDPVCGCDDMTYGNECEANVAGISVASSGECGDPTEGETCGGLLGAQCAEGQYCNYTESAQCGAGDMTGLCADIPEGTCTGDYAPVCGCDDQTYSNACAAAAAGTSVASQGACP